MKVYQYVIIGHPTENDKKDGKSSEILKPTTEVLASDQKNAAIIAARAIPETWLTKLDRVEVAVRPF